MTPSQVITAKSSRLFLSRNAFTATTQVETLANGRVEVRVEFLNLPTETLHQRDKSALRLRLQYNVADLIMKCLAISTKSST